MIWLLIPFFFILILLVLFGGKHHVEEQVQIPGVFEKTRRNDG